MWLEELSEGVFSAYEKEDGSYDESPDTEGNQENHNTDDNIEGECFQKLCHSMITVSARVFCGGCIIANADVGVFI